MAKLILNDVHKGASRVSGTTQTTQMQIREYINQSFKALIFDHLDKDLVIPGDFFDGFTVDPNEILESYFTLSEWLQSSGRKFYFGAGNHDVGKRTDKLSSFDVLASLLQERFPLQVVVVKNNLYSDGDLHLIPHCMNQDLFDIELEKAMQLEGGSLLLHANAVNPYAVEADHSLNVSREQLEELSKNLHVQFAHIHQASTMNFGYKDITIYGNQYPSSISDCLGNTDKYAHVLEDDGTLTKIRTWSAKGDFIQVDWTDLDSDLTERFIRVTGRASASQASDVVSKIANYRSTSKALVISNAVQIDGVEGMDTLAQTSFEQVTSFDVLGALLKELEPKEQEAVRSLLDV